MRSWLILSVAITLIWRGAVAPTPLPSTPTCVNGATCVAIATPSTSSTGFTPGSGATVIRPRFSYGSEKIRGVNLGGWFVIEPWINPSLFNQTNNPAIIDEYTYGLYQSGSQTESILQNHWDTWITEDDFAAISQAGLNHVRIPIPYWAVPTANTSTSPFITGSWSRLLRAVSWASSYSISVIIDIHGAPGSQNGYDNSGQRLSYPQWQKAQENIDRTVQVFQALINEFTTSNWGGTVGVIEALNEPAGFYQDVLDATNGYWQQAYGVLQDYRLARGSQTGVNVDPTEIKMAIMDAFQGVEAYQGFLTPPGSQGVLMDIHNYQIFNGWQYVTNITQHPISACAFGQSISTFSTSNLWTYVGEWSSVMNDCALWLNGRWLPSLWETAVPGRSCVGMTGAWQTFSPDYISLMTQYFEAQITAYEEAEGWVFWCAPISLYLVYLTLIRSVKPDRNWKVWTYTKPKCDYEASPKTDLGFLLL
ncbi:exo-1,3-beta-glucanase [Tulasnella sp. JGI-2019a]|nr:exo-1,3-beta-glucanase [Tulasnella sp. JGI-2019a]